MKTIHINVSNHSSKIPPRLKLVLTRLGSLVLLFQRMPLVQALFPEASFLGGASVANSVSLAVTTVVGLGVYDTVAGATQIVQVTPVANSTSVPAAVNSSLNFEFICNTAPSRPKSWKTTALPSGLSLSYTNTTPTGAYNNFITGSPTTAGSFPVTITVYENSSYGGEAVSRGFTIYVLGFSTQPNSTTINSGSTTTLSCAVTGKPVGSTQTYQWYEGTSGTTTMPVGTNSASFTTPPLASSKNYWVKVTSVLSPSTVSVNSSTASVNVSAPSSVVTVDVAPASVLEDEASNLVYTFTRTGPTTAQLTASFNVGGTATFNTDYTQSGAWYFTSSLGNVTFSIGSSTTTVTIDPTPDSIAEADETVILTLNPGSGYTPGTAASATSTILNDESPYSSWASALPSGQNGPMDSPHGDGVTNLEKFAFNLEPLMPDTRHLSVGANDTAGLPGGAMVAGKLRIEFLRRISTTNPGISYTAQFGSDLAGWTDIPVGTPAGTPIDATWERVVVDDPTGGSQRFGRVKVVQIP